MVTHCLLSFSQRIARMKPEEWKAEIEQMPEVCPQKDCDPGICCRDVCAEYARVQWRCVMAKRRRAA